jgi:hypothetical protein
MMSDGKKNGTYLEIGCNDPFESNNTAILEGLFSYKSLSIDILKSQCINFANKRVNPVINANALKLNYKTLFKINKSQIIQFNKNNHDIIGCKKLINNSFSFNSNK